jgi:hypothetical protein
LTVAKLKKGLRTESRKATNYASSSEIENRLNQKIFNKLGVDLKNIIDVVKNNDVALTDEQKAILDNADSLLKTGEPKEENGEASKIDLIESADLASAALDPKTIPFILDSTGLVAKSAAAYGSPDQQFGAPVPKKLEKTYDKDDLDKIAKKLGIPVTDAFQDPYDEITKWRHHDALRIDLTSVTAFETKAQFIAGADLPDISLDTNRTWPDKDEEQKEIELINKHPLYQRIREDLKLIDQDVKFNKKLLAWIINKKGFGKACMVIQDDPYETDQNIAMPIALKVLSSMRIGQVFASEIDWEPVAIEYLDYKKPQNIIYRENFIYDANRNYHQSPGSLNYGFADSELFQHIVELNIIMNAMDLKEINKRLWAAILLIQLMTEDKNELNKFKQKLLAGGSIITALGFTAQEIKQDHNGDFILKERESNADEILRGAQVPKQFAGLGGTFTKSEASIITHAWNRGPIAKEKLDVRLIMEEQWYGRNLLKLIKKIAVEAGLDYKTVQKQDPVTPQTKTEEFDLLIHKKEHTVIPKDIVELKSQITELLKAESLKELPFKIKMESKPISYETDIERAAVADLLKQDDAFDIIDMLEYMGFDDLVQKKKKSMAEQAKKLDAGVKANMEQMGLDINDPASIPRIMDILEKQQEKPAPFGGGGGATDGNKKRSISKLSDRLKIKVKNKVPKGTENAEIGTTTA